MLQLDNAVKYFRRIILDELAPIAMVYVAGGCVRDYFSVGHMTSDIDLYFPDEESFNKIRDYLLQAKTRTIETVEDDTENDKTTITRTVVPKKRAEKLFENDSVLKLKYNNREYDLVKKYFPTPDACIDAFDFTVCCAAIDTNKVYTHESFFIDLAKRQLMIHKLPFPLSTMWRMQKYMHKGYRMCSEQMLKLSKAIGELQTNTPQGEEQAVDLQPMSEGGGPDFRGFD